jgi:pSer/pThr/pTyr-binding forkhead associated (FHA) protein/tetratricopeptide (TPR) repeat protein
VISLRTGDLLPQDPLLRDLAKRRPEGARARQRGASEPPWASAEIVSADPNGLHVVVTSRNAPANPVALHDGDNLIGRSASCDVEVNHPSVSRNHAMLAVEAGKVTVRDLGSVNGTFINGRPVQSPTRLRIGDELRIGHVSMAVRNGVGEPKRSSRRNAVPSSGMQDKRSTAGPRSRVAEQPLFSRAAAPRAWEREPISATPRTPVARRRRRGAGGIFGLMLAATIGAGIALVYLKHMRPELLPALPLLDRAAQLAPAALRRPKPPERKDALPAPPALAAAKPALVKPEAKADAAPAPAPAKVDAKAADPKKAEPAKAVAAAPETPKAPAADPKKPDPAQLKKARAEALRRYKGGDLEGALDALDPLRKGDPGISSLARSMEQFRSALNSGRAELASRDAKAATDAFQKALALDRRIADGSGRFNAEVRENLGKLHYVLGLRAFDEGDKDKARAQFVAAAKADPSNENVKRWLSKLNGS